LDTSAGREWKCPLCDHLVRVDASEPGVNLPTACLLCGERDLYKKKGFPHWLGLTILAAACLAFFGLSLMYLQYWAWAILLASAVVDGLLYLYVPDVVVCYRCGTNHCGVGATEGYRPFELAIAERFRQERIRREQRKSQTGTAR
jgi:hypothetical protein